ncbi:hypothetical protein DEI99_005100 [Curtobacterium sp. MCLR17_036]|nr:hypothetical protein [Curtobacterium sp. MCLR17_036]WIE65916.1 hypothetical protein DEI99_005100 [Curtobacterium sp. MCLR17_036]
MDLRTEDPRRVALLAEQAEKARAAVVARFADTGDDILAMLGLGKAS